MREVKLNRRLNRFSESISFFVGGRGSGRRGQEGGRGGGQPRSQRFNKFDGQQGSNDSGWIEQGGNTWNNEAGNDNQSGGGFRGRGGRGGGRGRGRGNFEGGRGGGRGRGRGNFGNRNFEEGSQQQTGDWQTNEPNAAQTTGQEFEGDAANQERPFESGNQRGGRGQFRTRTFHSNRNYTNSRSNQHEGGEHDESRQARRQHDRQPRSYVSGVKPVEKRGGEGAHNWGKPTENLEEAVATDEQTETTGEQATSAPKDWSQQVDEAEKQMTLDEYKKQVEAKKRANQEKVPQLNPRTANEGVDPKQFKAFEQTYRKNEDDEEEVEDDDEENVDEEDDDQHAGGKKKIINIPLFFKPIDAPRGGPRRGSGRFRPNRDDQTRSKSPNQQTGDSQANEQQSQQSRPYRGGSRGGSGRGEYRRSYGNSNRGSRGGYNRSNANSYTPDFGNAVDFPTLAK